MRVFMCMCMCILDERIPSPSHSSSPTQPLPSPYYLPFLPLPLLRWTILYTHRNTLSLLTHVHMYRIHRHMNALI